MSLMPSTTPNKHRRPGSHPAAKGRETEIGRTRRARRINRTLAETFPDAHAELDFTNPLELLVATVLSAQTTDARVNMVTPALFAAYPTAHAYAEADQAEVEEIMASLLRVKEGPVDPVVDRSTMKVSYLN